MIKQVIFYNNYHNGDIHNSRGIVNKIIKLFGTGINYCYFHNNSSNHLKDLPVSHIKSFAPWQKLVTHQNETIIINTHIGCKYNNFQFCKDGCNVKSNVNMLNCIYKELGVSIEQKDEWELIPEIDFSHYQTDLITNFFKQNNKKTILFCNGNVWSGQAPNFSFDPIVDYFTNKYSSYNFVVTKHMEEKHNLWNASNIIKSGNDSDLVEISFLSEFCDVVVGRSSGPFTFAQTKNNLNTENKTFISFNDTEPDAYFTQTGKTKKIWSNNYDIDHIIKVIEENL